MTDFLIWILLLWATAATLAAIMFRTEMRDYRRRWYAEQDEVEKWYGRYLIEVKRHMKAIAAATDAKIEARQRARLKDEPVT